MARSIEKEVHLPEADSEVFQAFYDWLYGRYPGTYMGRSLRGMDSKEALQLYYLEVFCLYV